MIRGMYAAASAMLAGLYRQRALSHNIANLDTPGFKQLMVSLDDFLNVPVEDPVSGAGQTSIGDLGLGVQADIENTDFSPGGVVQTQNELDFAIAEGGFFRIETPEGEGYTRDGRFMVNSDGILVTADGHFVLNDKGQKIEIPAGIVGVQEDGLIHIDGAEIDRLGLASFTDPQTDLERMRGNIFSTEGAPTGDETVRVLQGYIEGSNVDSAFVMTQMVAVNRAYEAAQQMVQVQDELLGRVISTLGRW
jgi:flagellar basal-body rod protein FlgF